MTNEEVRNLRYVLSKKCVSNLHINKNPKITTCNY